MQISTHQPMGAVALQCSTRRSTAQQRSTLAFRDLFTAFRPKATGTRHMQLTVHADGDGAPQQGDEAARQEEARIAALEKLTRSGPDQKKRQQSAMQRTQQKKAPEAAAGKGRWREGELFPQGWENMGPFEKGWQLWAGERGFLFWSNKLALGAIVVLAVAWVLFRFVGPALGLYTLTNDLLSPPNE